jgi:hypothetical protein
MVIVEGVLQLGSFNTLRTFLSEAAPARLSWPRGVRIPGGTSA